MKEKESIFERISAGAISREMPECKAVILNIGGREVLEGSFSRLYSASGYKIYLAETTPSKLNAALKRCRDAGVPAIVCCGESLPDLSGILPHRPYTAALVSPGSGRDPLETFLNDPNAEAFAHLGFQTYLYDPRLLARLRERYFEEMRLGIIRSDQTQPEPLLRNAEFVFFDMRAVRYSDYPWSVQANPNGLYAEEACQLIRYAGLSRKLKIVFLYGQHNPGPCTGENPAAGCRQAGSVCSFLSGELCWHLCEGIAANLPENPEEQAADDSFPRKIVRLGQDGQELVFITSTATGRWWMEIPCGSTKQTKTVPCSLKDYQTACTGEVPVRWLFYYQKYAIL